MIPAIVGSLARNDFIPTWCIQLQLGNMKTIKQTEHFH